MRKLVLLLVLVCCVGAIGLVSAETDAVELVYFDADPSTAFQNRLEWLTETETDTAGFIVVRGDSADDPIFDNPTMSDAIPLIYNGASTTFIDGEGSPVIGSLYIAYDPNVQPNTEYWYLLLELAFNGFLEDLEIDSALTYQTTLHLPIITND